VAAGLLAAVHRHPETVTAGRASAGAETAFVALRRADNELLAAALEEPFPCEWSAEGCADDADAMFGGD
jgi:hypothetical protein